MCILSFWIFPFSFKESSQAIWVSYVYVINTTNLVTWDKIYLYLTVLDFWFRTLDRAQLISVLKVSQDLNHSDWQPTFIAGGFRRKSTCKLFLIGGRVQFIGFVGLKSLFPEDHQPQVLEKTLESPLDWKEINPKYWLEGLVLKMNFQYFNHLMWRANSLEKILMLEKTEGKRRSGGRG